MAQFALYNYQFFELPLSEIRDKGQLYGAGAKPEVMAFKDSFPKRQEIFGSLLSEDFESGAQKIKFKGERQMSYGHLHVMKPTDDIVILKVISKHSVALHDKKLRGRRFNQLIRLGKTQQADNSRFDDFCKENQISPDLYLLPDEVAAYFFRANADGTVSIEYQDAAGGIPFTTFHDIVTQQEHVDDQIETMMED